MSQADGNGDLRLAGRVALVTGGSRGLGRETVLGFARAGADVVIASRKHENCVRLAEEVTERTGRAALAVQAHVGRWEDLERLVEESYERFGRIDVLVNNAGMSPHYDRLVDVTKELWDKVLDVNLAGPFRLSALVGERMLSDGGGSIINVSSIGSLHATPNIVPYAAAKAGLNAITQGFARALGPSVRVNAILAGAFLTDVSKAWDMDAFNEEAKAYSLGRAAEPREIVGTMLYLASDESSFTTGALIQVDGGYVET